MFRALGVLLLLVVLGVVAMLNLDVFAATTALSLGYTTVQVPLAGLLLGLLVIVSVVYMGWMLRMQTAAIAQTRRYDKELQAQRALADQAEASRVVELRQHVSAELQQVATAVAASQQALIARLDAFERQQIRSLEEQSNSLSASIGELDDRLHREAAYTIPRSASAATAVGSR